MSARANVSKVVYLPSVADQSFLKNTVETLERLRSESELHGHHLLASLLAITKGEAEDDLRTRAKTLSFLSRDHDHDEDAAKMARKLACRAGARSRKGT